MAALPSSARRVAVRLLRPSDRPALAALFTGLSPRSSRRRFLGAKHGLTTAELRYFTDIDQVSHAAVAAVDAGGTTILGEARYAPWQDRPRVADLAFVVADAMQGRGIGTLLALEIVAHARHSGITLLTASTHEDNRPAQTILRRLGFRTVGRSSDVIDLELRLGPQPC
jgi:RimJ/RimL family protein N-acetyltransferase